MTVIKRKKGSSTADLISAIKKFNDLLESQKEDEAVEALNKAAQELENSPIGSQGYTDAIASIIDAFEGEHELNAYTHQREETGQWTTAEELSQASWRVISLARRLQNQ